MSPKTVDVDRGRIKQKLQLKDAASLIHHAVRSVETQATQS
jgi:DNA-binding CsgD family transcriptional regulator